MIDRKQGELVRMTEMEEEEETSEAGGSPWPLPPPRRPGSIGPSSRRQPGLQDKRGPRPQAIPDRQVGGQDVVAMIRQEVGEETTEIRKSIDKLRSFHGCHQDAVRWEEATTK